jgi:hypothetical protein
MGIQEIAVAVLGVQDTNPFGNDCPRIVELGKIYVVIDIYKRVVACHLVY